MSDLKLEAHTLHCSSSLAYSLPVSARGVNVSQNLSSNRMKMRRIEWHALLSSWLSAHYGERIRIDSSWWYLVSKWHWAILFRPLPPKLGLHSFRSAKSAQKEKKNIFKSLAKKINLTNFIVVKIDLKDDLDRDLHLWWTSSQRLRMPRLSCKPPISSTSTRSTPVTSSTSTSRSGVRSGSMRPRTMTSEVTSTSRMPPPAGTLAARRKKKGRRSGVLGPTPGAGMTTPLRGGGSVRKRGSPVRHVVANKKRRSVLMQSSATRRAMGAIRAGPSTTSASSIPTTSSTVEESTVPTAANIRVAVRVRPENTAELQKGMRYRHIFIHCQGNLNYYWKFKLWNSDLPFWKKKISPNCAPIFHKYVIFPCPLYT